MEFIENEAECEDYSSDQCYVSTEQDDEDHSSFIDGSESVGLNDPISLYAKNVSEIEEPAEDAQPFQYGGDQLGSEIHSFSKAPKLLAHFRKSLLGFPRCGDNENYFYSSVILGLFYVKNDEAIPKDLDESRQGLLLGAVHLERIKK